VTSTLFCLPPAPQDEGVAGRSSSPSPPQFVLFFELTASSHWGQLKTTNSFFFTSTTSSPFPLFWLFRWVRIILPPSVRLSITLRRKATSRGALVEDFPPFFPSALRQTSLSLRPPPGAGAFSPFFGSESRRAFFRPFPSFSFNWLFALVVGPYAFFSFFLLPLSQRERIATPLAVYDVQLTSHFFFFTVRLLPVVGVGLHLVSGLLFSFLFLYDMFCPISTIPRRRPRTCFLSDIPLSPCFRGLLAGRIVCLLPPCGFFLNRVSFSYSGR